MTDRYLFIFSVIGSGALAVWHLIVLASGDGSIQLSDDVSLPRAAMVAAMALNAACAGFFLRARA